MFPQLALIVLGVLGTLVPRRCVDTMKRLMLWPSYENTEELRARRWVITFVRLQSLGALLIGLYGLVQSRNDSLPPIPDNPDLTPTED